MRKIILYFLFGICIFLASSYLKSQQVLRIIDGDTFEIHGGQKVRMIGINTPEKSDIYGEESTKYLSDLIWGQSVILKADIESKETDRYGRLLRYVQIDSTDVNLKMVEDGYAFAYLKYKFTKKNEYYNAQINAQKNGVGIWGNSVKLNPKEQVVANKLDTKRLVLAGGIILLIVTCLISIRMK